MNGKVNRAYAYYKAQYPASILLFRVGNFYEAYLDDAEKIRELLGSSQLKFAQHAQTVCLPSDNILECVSQIDGSGCKIRLIEYRNDAGEYVIPDVECLESEKEMDY